MAKAVTARIAGDDYQARFFWYQVCRMFHPNTNVKSVSYEWDEVRGFDDVVVAFDPPVPDDRGGATSTDYFQVKYHVNQAHSITWKDLLSPAFIGTTSVSLLQRLKSAVDQASEQKKGCRFILVTPWYIDSKDVLASLVSNNAGEFRLDRLFDHSSGSRGQMGKIRSVWATHLAIEESQLAQVLSPFRIQAGWGGLSVLSERLNDKLLIAGLKPVAEECIANPYDDLIRKLVRSGETSFSADRVEEICRRENLWVGTVAPESKTSIGIRSFIRYAEYMEDETEHMLDLVPYFSGRTIRSSSLWSGAILPELSTFLEQRLMRSQTQCRLYLETHSSIAFAAGYYLSTRAGAQVVPIQKSISGKQAWTPQSELRTRESSSWNLDIKIMSPGLPDIAVGISITHDVSLDVVEYIRYAVLGVREFLHFRMLPVPSSTAIEDGPHALILVQNLVARLRDRRNPSHPDQTIHLFIAAPNAFTFFLGQHGRGLGKCVIYEYAFDSGTIGAYQPAVRFPEGDASRREED